MKPPLPPLDLVLQVPPCSLLISQLHHHLPISIPAPPLTLPNGERAPCAGGRGERQKKQIQLRDWHKPWRVNNNAGYSSLGMAGLGHCYLLLFYEPQRGRRWCMARGEGGFQHCLWSKVSLQPTKCIGQGANGARSASSPVRSQKWVSKGKKKRKALYHK